MSMVQVGVESEYLRLMKVFYRKTRGSVFSSDTFRLLGLDKYLPSKSRNAIGRFFALGVEWGCMEEVGRMRSGFDSTHGRKVGQYTWSEKASEELK